MIVLVGLDHKSAPVSVRERLAFSEDEIPAALKRLRDEDGIEEAVILSTCNRVEIVVRARDEVDGAATVRGFLARERQVDPAELDGHLKRYVNHEAVLHLYRVAAGLDSMILGEPQILGQVKKAYKTARAAGTTGPILDQLYQRGFAAAKEVRTETGISRYPVSIAFAAVELARKIFGELDGRSVLVVGAGKMAELAARHLTSSGIARVVVTSRRLEQAEKLALRFNGEAVPWDDLWNQVAAVDVIVAGTAAPGIVLSREGIEKALRTRRGRPLFIIDIAVPRDVEASVNELKQVYLYDVDDLQGVVQHNLDERKRAAAESHGRIESHGEAFGRWIRGLRMTPAIVALRETLMDVRTRELERHRKKLAELSPDQIEAVEELTRGIIQKVLHSPIQYLKNLEDRGDAPSQVALYRAIFGIPEDESADEASADGEGPSSKPANGSRRVAQGK